MPAFAEVVHSAGTCLQVVLVEPRPGDGEAVLGQRDRIGMAMGLAEAPLVGAGNSWGAASRMRSLGGARHGIEDEALETARTLVGAAGSPANMVS